MIRFVSKYNHEVTILVSLSVHEQITNEANVFFEAKLGSINVQPTKT